MRIVLCVLLVVFPMRWSARAADDAPADLRALLAAVDATNPELLAGQARTRGALEASERAQALPDPKLSVSYTNDGLDALTLGSSEFSNITVAWEQEVTPREVREAASGVARADAEVARVSVDGVRVRLRARVIALYADLYRLDRTRELLGESRGILATEVAAIRVRYESGQAHQESLLRAQVELRRLDLAGEELASARRAVVLAVNETLARGPEEEIGSALVLPEGALPEDLASAVREAPAVREAERRSARAEAAVAEARSSGKPEFSWVAAYQFRGGLDPMVMGGFGVRLPVWKNRKQARGIAQSEAELEVAERDAEAAALRARTQILAHANDVASAERRLLIYREALIPEDTAALDAARAAYSAGRADMTLVLEAFGRLLKDRQESIALEAGKTQALASLEALTGAELIDVNRTEAP